MRPIAPGTKRSVTGWAIALSVFSLVGITEPSHASESECPAAIPANPDGAPVKCEKGDTENTYINITLNNYSITAPTGKKAIFAHQKGLANVGITVSGGSIQSTGKNIFGIHGFFDRLIPGTDLWDPTKWSSPGPGNLTIRLRDVSVETTNLDFTPTPTESRTGSAAVYGQHAGTGELLIDVVGGKVTSNGDYSHAISGKAGRLRDGNQVIAGEISNIRIDIRDSEIQTNGDFSRGILGRHQNIGDVTISVSGGSIVTKGKESHAVHGFYNNPTSGNAGAQPSNGKITIDVAGTTINTTGTSAYGVMGYNGLGVGPMEIMVRGADIKTTGWGAHAIAGVHTGNGPVDVTIMGGSIVTEGNLSRGISVRKSKEYNNRADGASGALTARVLESASIRASGKKSAGILMRNSTGESMLVDIDETSSVKVTGADANGVQFGSFATETGALEFAAAVGEDGYRQQTLRINGSVEGGSGDGAAVFMAGGGKVIVGTEGQLRAASGVAIETSNGSTKGAPRLLVDVAAGGRKMSDIIEGRIVNDGGVTTISVNGVTLHDGSRERTDVSAPNGARDVSLRTTLGGSGAQEFSLVETFAPRAALYEALPGFLSRLESGRMTRRLHLADGESPPPGFRFSIDGHGGSFAARGATVGAEYEWRSRIVGARFAFPLTGSLQWQAGAHLINGHAAVSAATGGGRIEVSGSSVTVGAKWQVAGSSYIRSAVSAAKYGLEMTSSKRGRLVNTVSAGTIVGHLEAGRSIAGMPGGIERGVARAWLRGGRVSIDGFKDRTAARLAPVSHTHMAIGVGMTLATPANVTAIEGLSLHGDLGVEHALGGGQTTVVVAGQLPGTSERLSAHGRRSRVLFGAGAMWQNGSASIEAALHGAATHRRDISLHGRITVSLALQ